MYRYISLLLCVVGVCCVSADAYAQIKNLKKADKYYKLMKYNMAVPIYEEALKEKDDQPYVKGRLAYCYRLTNKPHKAEPLYSSLARVKSPKPQAIFYYAESLMYTSKYDSARVWLKTYTEIEPNDERGVQMLRALDWVSKIKPVFTNVQLRSVESNSPADDFAPIFYDKGIVFLSDRSEGDAQTSGWTGRAYLAPYYSSVQADGTLADAVPFNLKGYNKEKNVGPSTFSFDGQEFYYTRNNDVPSDREIYKLAIYKSVKSGDTWKVGEILPIGNNNYNTMHPAISGDGSRLYFSSDKGGGYGGFDLYYCNKRPDGTWSPAKNLGPEVNSSGDEAFPFVSADNQLYFASRNGHPGLGGFDLFVAEQVTADTWSKPTNLGFPINSSNDETGIALSALGNEGYFASSRSETGDDDVYYFRSFPVNLEGRVNLHGKPLADVTVTLSAEGQKTISVAADTMGYFKTPINAECVYRIVAKHPLHDTTSQVLSTLGILEATDLNIVLNYKKQASTIGTAQPAKITTPIAAPGRTSISIYVADKDEAKPVSKAKLVLINQFTFEEVALLTNDKGYAEVTLAPNAQYKLTVVKDNYYRYRHEATINTSDQNTQIFNVLISRIVYNTPVAINDAFVPGETQLHGEAATHLDMLVERMGENPELKVEISTANSDKTITDLRAQAVANYLISRGIDPQRIQYTGLGSKAGNTLQYKIIQ